MDYFYYFDAGKVAGPHSLNEIQEIFTTGTITTQTPIVRAGEKDWQTLEAYCDLNDLERLIEEDKRMRGKNTSFKKRLEELANQRIQRQEIEKLERMVKLQERAKEYLAEISEDKKESKPESREQEKVNTVSEPEPLQTLLRQEERPELHKLMPLWKQTLLWISLLPGALLGSTVAFWIAKLFTWLGSSAYGHDTWLDLISNELLTNGASGGAFVYCGSFIAPRYKKTTAICFAATLLLISGISILRRISEKDWMGLLGAISFVGGGIILAVRIVTGETEV